MSPVLFTLYTKKIRKGYVITNKTKQVLFFFYLPSKASYLDKCLNPFQIYSLATVQFPAHSDILIKNCLSF